VKNEVQLSGRLATHPEVGTSERGAQLAKCRLQFNAKDDSIPLFCVSEQADILSRLEIGAQVSIVGRLVIRGVGKRVAVAVDRIETATLQAPDSRAEMDFFETMRRHSQNAQVKGRKPFRRCGQFRAAP
jgi:hypothetical protein